MVEMLLVEAALLSQSFLPKAECVCLRELNLVTSMSSNHNDMTTFEGWWWGRESYFQFVSEGFHGRYLILLTSPNIPGSPCQLSIQILSSVHHLSRP